MKASQDLVAPLKKIYLQLRLAPGSDPLPAPSAVQHGCSFIYGVGSSGLTPFEFKLSALNPGDTVNLTIEDGQWETYFGHLSIPWPDTLPDSPRRHLQVRVKAVETPSRREIIQAMADATACGGGCCGNH